MAQTPHRGAGGPREGWLTRLWEQRIAKLGTAMVILVAAIGGLLGSAFSPVVGFVVAGVYVVLIVLVMPLA